MQKGLVKSLALDLDVKSVASSAKASMDSKIAEVGADIELLTRWEEGWMQFGEIPPWRCHCAWFSCGAGVRVASRFRCTPGATTVFLLKTIGLWLVSACNHHAITGLWKCGFWVVTLSFCKLKWPDSCLDQKFYAAMFTWTVIAQSAYFNSLTVEFLSST